MRRLSSQLLASLLCLFSFASIAATNQVTGRQVTTRTITDNNIANGTIQSLQIANKTIVDNDIANGTITGLQTSSNFQFTGDIGVARTKKVFLDAGNDDYLSSSSDNSVSFFTGGTAAFDANNTRFSVGSTRDLWIDPTKRFYYDGGGDSYSVQTSDNNIAFFTGGTSAFDFNNSRVSIASTRDFWVDPTKSIFFDGGVDTRIYEVSNNLVSIVAGGTTSFQVASDGVVIGGGATMNKYDQGTCATTITLVGGSGNVVPVYTTNSCRYTRIGRLVFIDYFYSGDGGAEGSGTGVITLALPIISSGSHQTDHVPCGSGTNNAQENILYCQIPPSSSTMSIFFFNTINAIESWTGNNQDNSTRIMRVKVFYEI